jgi:rubrerythrin
MPHADGCCKEPRDCYNIDIPDTEPFGGYTMKIGKEELCPACGKRVEDCVCCPECGHLCALDEGGLYCPVCGPVKSKEEGEVT